MTHSAIVFGAGKVARGFLGDILHKSGFAIWFVEIDPVLTGHLNRAGCYTVHMLGTPEQDSVVTGVSALTPDDPGVATAVLAADIAFVSVGGANLPAVAGPLAAGLVARLRAGAAPFNVIVCENWRNAAAALRTALLTHIPAGLQARFAAEIGVAEATILRSGIAATPEQLAADPASVQSHSFWSLPLDGDAVVGTLPAIIGLEPVANFSSALERKLYTYNTANASIAFLGYLRGHTFLAEAAHDPVILPVVARVYEEMSTALIAKFGLDPAEQRRFADQSLAKFQDWAIVDPIARQVADPLRKLGHEDRLVGAALTALAQGVQPTALALVIAAALRYRNPDDPSAVELAQRVEQHGALPALAEIGGLPPDHPLIGLVRAATPALDALIAAPVPPDR